MGDLILAVAATASLLSPSVGSFIRSLYYRLRAGGRITVESATGVSRTDFIETEDPQKVADRVEELVERAEEPDHGRPADPGRPRATNFDIKLPEVLYGLAMLVGILAKEVWDYQAERGTLGFVGSQMTAATIVAPIVYVGVHASIQPLTKSVTLVGLAIAFQNGFFWQSVFSSVQAQKDGLATPGGDGGTG
jgi:hypothetical protein